jgi:hypothetical protein
MAVGPSDERHPARTCSCAAVAVAAHHLRLTRSTPGAGCWRPIGGLTGR